MEINTKYEIGQHVWHIYENKGEVCVFDDFIGWITIEDEKEIQSIETLNPHDEYFRDGTELVYKLMYDKINEIAMKVNQLDKKVNSIEQK